MSNQSQGPGWWVASDGKWYPPETHPSASTPAAPPPPVTQAVDLGEEQPALPVRAWRRYRGWPIWGQVGAALVLLVVITAPFTGSGDTEKVDTSQIAADDAAAETTTTTEAPTTTARPTTTTAAPTTTTTAPPTTTTAPPPPDPFAGETVSQRNARGSAEDYLAFTSFSRTGLIGQLEYEGFSNGDSTYAVDVLNVDWNEQAAKSAASYLEFSSFSRSGLIDQLVYEGFTQAQAEYGVNTTGL